MKVGACKYEWELGWKAGIPLAVTHSFGVWDRRSLFRKVPSIRIHPSVSFAFTVPLFSSRPPPILLGSLHVAISIKK